jgi:hypothetical protein
MTSDTGASARAVALHDPLSALIRDYPFNAYRGYRVISRRLQPAVLEAEITAILDSGRGTVLYDRSQRAALVLERLAWDSAFFGIPMARIHSLLRTDEAREPLDEVVRECIALCRAEGILHLTARADAGDHCATNVLGEHGFRLIETMLTYLHRSNDAIPETRDAGIVRQFREDDIDQIMAIASERFRAFRGRFHADPHLPDERCDELYLEWTRKCCSGELADEVLVTENAPGEIMGFLAFRKREPVSSITGRAIYGHALGAARADAPGAYLALTRGVARRMRDLDGSIEGQTQSHNFSTVRVYEATGSKYVRAEYTFHAWLG